MKEDAEQFFQIQDLHTEVLPQFDMSMSCNFKHLLIFTFIKKNNHIQLIHKDMNFFFILPR